MLRAAGALAPAPGSGTTSAPFARDLRYEGNSPPNQAVGVETELLHGRQARGYSLERALGADHLPAAPRPA
jgi:hypothetical protein